VSVAGSGPEHGVPGELRIHDGTDWRWVTEWSHTADHLACRLFDEGGIRALYFSAEVFAQVLSVDAVRPGCHNEERRAIESEDKRVRNRAHLDPKRGRGLWRSPRSVVEPAGFACSTCFAQGGYDEVDGGVTTHRAPLPSRR
jgi:hypothetical protein